MENRIDKLSAHEIKFLVKKCIDYFIAAEKEELKDLEEHGGKGEFIATSKRNLLMLTGIRRKLLKMKQER